MVRFDVSTENGTLDLFQERFHESFDSIIELVVPKNLKKKTRNEELGDKERTDQQKLVVTQNQPKPNQLSSRSVLQFLLVWTTVTAFTSPMAMKLSTHQLKPRNLLKHCFHMKNLLLLLNLFWLYRQSFFWRFNYFLVSVFGAKIKILLQLDGVVVRSRKSDSLPVYSKGPG